MYATSTQPFDMLRPLFCQSTDRKSTGPSRKKDRQRRRSCVGPNWAGGCVRSWPHLRPARPAGRPGRERTRPQGLGIAGGFGLVVLGARQAGALIGRPRPPCFSSGRGEHGDDRSAPGHGALPGVSGQVEAGAVRHVGAGHYQQRYRASNTSTQERRASALPGLGSAEAAPATARPADRPDR